MVNTTNKSSNKFIVYGFPLLLIISIVLFSFSSVFNQYSAQLSTFITIDLVLTIPLVYYFLIRKTEIDNKTVIRIFILGVVVATFIIPKENQFLLQQLKVWVLPVVELLVLLFVISKIRKALKVYQRNKTRSFDILETVRNTAAEIFPKRIANFLAIEFSSFYYGFLQWKKRELRDDEFTYHKNTGTQSMLGAFVFLLLAETIILHLLIAKFDPMTAWILTGLGAYSTFQVFGFLRSLNKRPTRLTPEKLHLHYGILSEVSIALEDIASIELSTKEIEENKSIRYLSPLGSMEGHNMILHLHKENTLLGFYGIKKEFKSLALHIDEKEKLKEKIEAIIIPTRLIK